MGKNQRMLAFKAGNYFCLKNIKSFSLVELLISLIILSLLLSAFSPVIVKKLKASDITIGNFNDNVGQLVLCKDGYHEFKDKCYLNIENCSGYDASNNCSACESGYALYNNKCYDAIDNCLIQRGDKCTYCNSGYTLYDNACYQSVANCQTQIGTTCSACQSGYYLYNERCIRCLCTNGSCDGGRIYCTSCDSGYVMLDKDTAQECVSCDPSNGFVKVGNLCVMQYNIGQGKYGESTSDFSADNTSTTIENGCWSGYTSLSGGQSVYDTKTRVVCTFNSANGSCSSLGWRLPTLSELESIANTTYSNSTLSSEGLMFCDGDNNSSAGPLCAPRTSACGHSYSIRFGTIACEPNCLWSSEGYTSVPIVNQTGTTTNILGLTIYSKSRCLMGGKWSNRTYYYSTTTAGPSNTTSNNIFNASYGAYSARCVKDL